METWLTKGHWQWLRAGRGGSGGGLCRICALGPWENRQTGVLHHSQCARKFAGTHPLSPLVTQKILHLGNCPSTAEKSASGLRPPVLAEPGIPPTCHGPFPSSLRLVELVTLTVES